MRHIRPSTSPTQDDTGYLQENKPIPQSTQHPIEHPNKLGGFSITEEYLSPLEPEEDSGETLDSDDIMGSDWMADQTKTLNALIAPQEHKNPAGPRLKHMNKDRTLQKRPQGERSDSFKWSFKSTGCQEFTRDHPLASRQAGIMPDKKAKLSPPNITSEGYLGSSKATRELAESPLAPHRTGNLEHRGQMLDCSCVSCRIRHINRLERSPENVPADSGQRRSAIQR